MALFACILSLGSRAASAQVADSAKTDSLTTLSKVYSALQAAKGKDTYAAMCLSCHKPAEFSGEKFWSLYVGKPLAEMFSYIKREMPQDNPATLSDEEYASVTAYILQLNSMPPGELPLPGDSTALAKIRVVPPGTPPGTPDTSRKGPRR